MHHPSHTVQQFLLLVGLPKQPLTDGLYVDYTLYVWRNQRLKIVAVEGHLKYNAAVGIVNLVQLLLGVYLPERNCARFVASS